MGARNDTYPMYLLGIVLLTAAVAISIIIHVTGNPGEGRAQNRAGLAISAASTPPAEDLGPRFALADDPFTTSSIPYLTASAAASGANSRVTVQVTQESGVYRQYVYRKGYHSNGSAWEEFTFPEPTVSGSSWILGQASYTSGDEQFNTDEWNYAIVFVCRKYSAEEQFICGPRAPKNPTIKNWTITTFLSPPPAPQTYTCPNNNGRFCGTSLSSLTGTNMTRTYSDNDCAPGTSCNTCPATQVCYQCDDGFTNVSGRCFSAQTTPTCPLQPNQFCSASVPQNATAKPSGGTCSGTGSQCYECNTNFMLQNGGCVFNMSKVNCETKPNQICLATQPAQSTRNETPGTICPPAEYCWACNAGFTLVNGQCVRCTTNTQCNDNNACTTDVCTNPNTLSASCTNTPIDPTCPANSTVACGQTINPTNNCGTCPGKGVKCATAAETCNVAASQCTAPSACTSNSQCNDSNACTTDTCLNPGTSSASCSHTTVLPTCPAASGVACNQQIMPTNGCGTCSGKGTLCADAAKSCIDGIGCVRCSGNTQCSDNNACTIDVCNNPGTTASSCTSTPIAPTCPAASTVACGQTINPTNGCGTCSGKGTMCTDTTKTCNTATWQCESTCTNECTTSGAKECSGAGYRTCGNYDADTCLEWSSVTSCATGQTCSNGACACTPKTKAQACGTNNCGSASDGCGGTISCGSCPTGQQCSSTTPGVPGTCQVTCTDGDTKCFISNGWYMNSTCANGEWGPQLFCPDQGGCSVDGKRCLASCTSDPGCSSSNVGSKQCSSTGVPQVCTQVQTGCYKWQDSTSQTLLCYNSNVMECGATVNTDESVVVGTKSYRCMGPSPYKWVDTTNQACLYIGPTNPTPLTCGACSAKTEIQTTINGVPYSTSNYGTVYYARCCPGSTYCSDVDGCYASGTPNPLFPQYVCNNGDWVTAPTCSPSCPSGQSCTGANTCTCTDTSKTNAIYNGGSGGVDWTMSVIDTRTSTACCDKVTQCADTLQCYSQGTAPLSNWACSRVSSRGTWIKCTSENTASMDYTRRLICDGTAFHRCSVVGTTITIGSQRYACSASPIGTEWTLCGGTGQSTCPN